MRQVILVLPKLPMRCALANLNKAEGHEDESFEQELTEETENKITQRRKGAKVKTRFGSAEKSKETPKSKQT
jgi:hypothetical protein